MFLCLLLQAVTGCVLSTQVSDSSVVQKENARSQRYLSEYRNAGLFYSSRIFDELASDILLKLSPGSEKTFRVWLARVAEDNAYALPTNDIIIHLGLLAMMDSVDQLAFVLAHELAHIESGHSYASARQRRSSRIKAQLGDILQLGSGKSYLHYASRLRSTNRQQELEADKMAAQWVQSAGYDLQKTEVFFTQLKLLAQLRSSDFTAGTHPALDLRRGLLSRYRQVASVTKPQQQIDAQQQFDQVRLAILPLVIDDKIAALEFADALRHLHTLEKIAGESPTTQCKRGTLFATVMHNDPDLHMFILDLVASVRASDDAPTARLYEKDSAQSAFAVLAKDAYQSIVNQSTKINSPNAVVDIQARDCALRGLGITLDVLGENTLSTHYLNQYLVANPDAVDARYIEHLLQR